MTSRTILELVGGFAWLASLIAVRVRSFSEGMDFGQKIGRLTAMRDALERENDALAKSLGLSGDPKHTP